MCFIRQKTESFNYHCDKEVVDYTDVFWRLGAESIFQNFNKHELQAV